MAQKLSNLVTSVSISQLKDKGIQYQEICPRKNPLHLVPSGTYHAIVKDEKTTDHIGIVFYSGENELPYAIFDKTAKYTFMRQGNVTRTHAPERIS